MEFLGSANSIGKLACRCAVSDGVPRRSLYVALVVGTVTYCVPYAVCTYGAVSYQLRRPHPLAEPGA
jgi:hypothetical protein